MAFKTLPEAWVRSQDQISAVDTHTKSLYSPRTSFKQCHPSNYVMGKHSIPGVLVFFFPGECNKVPEG